MPAWDPAQYAQFAAERARPCRDLIAAIQLASPQRIVDLGCGPGNSATVLAERWPDAEITGIDTSAEMIEAAKAANARVQFMQQDVTAWAGQAAPVAQSGEPDLIFSNAALQWVPDHDKLMPQLMQRVAPGGALALQMPSDGDAPAHVAARELADSSEWHAEFAVNVDRWRVAPADFYYDTLAPHAARLDIWTTEYAHMLPSLESIVEWYRGSSLRPYLNALRTLSARNKFLAQYTERLRAAYPVRTGGKVLLPFRRLFVVAYR